MCNIVRTSKFRRYPSMRPKREPTIFFKYNQKCIKKTKHQIYIKIPYNDLNPFCNVTVYETERPFIHAIGDLRRLKRYKLLKKMRRILHRRHRSWKPLGWAHRPGLPTNWKGGANRVDWMAQSGKHHGFRIQYMTILDMFFDAVQIWDVLFLKVYFVRARLQKVFQSEFVWVMKAT